MSEAPPSATFTQTSQMIPLRDPVYLRVPRDEWARIRKGLEALDCDVTWIPVVVGITGAGFVGEVVIALVAEAKGNPGLDRIHWAVAAGFLLTTVGLVIALSEKRKRVRSEKHGVMGLLDLVDGRHDTTTGPMPEPESTLNSSPEGK